MARTVAWLLAATIALATALIVSDALHRKGASLTEPAPASSAAALRSSTAAPIPPTADYSADLDGPLPALTDGVVRALLARLLGLDGVAALADDALVRLVAHDLADALRVSSSLSDAREQTLVLERIADFAVGIDARAALAAAGTLDTDTARSTYTRAALEAWAAVDPAAVLAHVETNRSSGFDWRPLARFDPYAVIVLTSRLGAGTSDGIGSLEEAQNAALSVWAEEDPAAAAAYVEAIPNGPWKNSAIHSVARSYAQYDARAAWQWARELDAFSSAGLSAIVSTVAPTDIGTAFDLLIEYSSADDVQNASASAALLLLTQRLDLGPAGNRRAADDLLARDDLERTGRLLNAVVSQWANEQPRAALDWVVENSARLGNAAPLGSFAQLSRDDPELALRTLRRLPLDRRVAWLTAVGRELAAVTPAPAAAALDTLVGEAGYETALGVVAEGLARSDPAAVVRLIEAASPDARKAAIGRAAAAMGRFAPQEAVRWAQGLDDAADLAVVVAGIASGWGFRDRQGAADWVLALPPGTPRDAGLARLFEYAAQWGLVDEVLLAPFASADARRASVKRAAETLASRGHPDAARDLAARFLPTLEERAAIDTMIERAAEPRGDTTLGGDTESGARDGPRAKPEDVLLERPPRRAAAARDDETPAEQTPAQRVAARRAAHAESERLRGDVGGIAALAARLPRANGRRFMLEALERMAATEGEDAFAEAVVLEEPLLSAALRRIAVPWAMYDPYAAIAAADRLPDPDLRHRYTRDVLLTWARVDSPRVARYFETAKLDAPTIKLVRELEQVILAHPASARIVAERLAGEAP